MNAYSGVLWKDKLSRYGAQILGPKMQHDPSVHVDDTIGDVLPSKRSINSTYHRCGFTFNPKTGMPVPPNFEEHQQSSARRHRQASTTRGGATKRGSETRSRSSLAPSTLAIRSTVATPSASSAALRPAGAAASDVGEQSSLSKSAPSQLSWPAQSGAPGAGGRASEVETWNSIWTLPPPASQLSKVQPPTVHTRPLLRSVSEPFHETVKVSADSHELAQIIFRKCRDKDFVIM